ncbi:DMT family transporter [Lentzea sp. NPDC059081]|uniref:DMT family transporter n=1 Tax=Lentzea sp. NPDC059081 TaxID=3346719 RepID=UPI0036C05BF2
MKGTAVAFGALLVATLFWAGNYVVGGAAVSTFAPLDLVAFRWAIAVLPLFALAHLVERPDWRQVFGRWRTAVVPALIGLLGYNVLLYTALQHTDAVNASLINAFNPALISLGATLFFRQRLTPLAILGVVVALAGVLWVLSGGNPASLLSTGFGVGDLLMLGAITAWTAYSLMGRRASGAHPIANTAVQALVAVVVMVPVVVLTGGPHVPAGTGTVLVLLFVGLGPSVVSYVMWNRALMTIPPARAGVFLNLITVFTVVMSAALGKPVTAAEILGGAVVLVGVAMTNADAFRRPARDEEASRPD